jgi:cysteine synthase
VLDDRILVRSRPALASTKKLMESEGIFAGISSGAVMLAAQEVAERMERGNVVVLLADGGWKYLSTRLWTKAYEEAAPEEMEGKVWR